MKMIRGNKAIRDHQKEGKIIHLFEDADTGLVRYLGHGIYLGHHFEDRPDVKDNMRKAIIFELEIDALDAQAPEATESPKSNKKTTLKLWSRPLQEVYRLASQRPNKTATPKERRAITYLYQGSEAVRIYVLRRANGICEGCGSNAPFVTKQRRPYLEPHHVRRRADGGPDDPGWVAALCPNCHREVHYGVKGEELNQRLSDILAKTV